MPLSNRSSIIANQDVAAATFVVGDDLSVADFQRLEDALANLPAAGGSIGLLGNTLTPPTGGYTMPNKPVSIFGSGASSIISIGSTVTPIFNFGFDNLYSFSNFRATGNGVAGQTLFNFPSGTSFTDFIVMSGLRSTGIEKIFVDSAGGYAYVMTSDCRFRTPNLTTSLYWDGPGEWWASNTYCDAASNGRGGFTVNTLLYTLNLYWSNSTARLRNGGDVSYVRLDGCGFADGPLIVNAQGSVLNDCQFESASFAPARYIDLVAGANACVITGCSFGTGSTSESVRIDSANNVVTGNEGLSVTELSGPNTYDNNPNLIATIASGGSVVNGAKRFGSTGATVDAYATLFTHTNPKGLMGIGTIKNTDGADSLTIEEQVIDAFAVTTTVETVVTFGDTYMLDLQTNFSTTGFPPYTSYRVRVKSTSPGNPASYSIQFVTQGDVT